MPAEETTDLEELEQFAKIFKQKRIKLGKFSMWYRSNNAFSESACNLETKIKFQE